MEAEAGRLYSVLILLIGGTIPYACFPWEGWGPALTLAAA